MAPGGHYDRICLYQWPHFHASARRMEYWLVVGAERLVRGIAADLDRGLHSRGCHRGIGTRLRAVSAIHTAAQYSPACVLSRPQPRGKLLSRDPRAELDEYRCGRSAVFVGKALIGVIA